MIINRFYLTTLFLWLGVLMMPYYFFSSGGIQISHIFFLVFFLLILSNSNGFWGVKKGYFFVFAFYLYSLIINIIYVLIYEDFSFLMFNAQMIFNIMLFMCIIAYMDKDECRHYNINKVFFVVIIMVLLLWLLGLGSYNYYPRYNGFFNDPNQMAFFILCSMSIILSLEKSNVVRLFTMLIGTMLILLTISRSAILGLGLLLVSYIISYLSYKRVIYLLGIAIVCFFYFIVFFDYEQFLNSDIVNNIIGRINVTDVNEQASIRGYNRIFDYPEYLIFGAGQGLDSRFNTHLEIHSTWAAILFYYGVVGFSIFLGFVIYIFKGLNLYRQLLFLAPMIYSFSTLGVRTPIFWFFLAIFFTLSQHNDKRYLV